MYTVIDNYLSKNYFNKIKKDFLDKETAWYFRDKATPKTKSKKGYFTHCLFNKDKVRSPYIDNLKVFFEKLKVKTLIQVRANLVLSTQKPEDTGWHTDYEKHLNYKTAIFFLINSNSKTLIKIKKKVIKIKSKENRIVIFDNEHEHKLLTHTKPLRRIILNINYY